MKYVYPAIFYHAVEGGWYVEFPDVASAITCGEDLYETIYMAEDVLGCSLMWAEDDGEEIPKPTPIKEIKAEPDEYSTDAFVVLIKADTDVQRLLNAEWSLL